MSDAWKDPNKHTRCFGWHGDDGSMFNGAAMIGEIESNDPDLHYIPITKHSFEKMPSNLKNHKDIFLVGRVPSVMAGAEFDTLAHYQENIDYFKEQSILWGFKIHDFRDGV